MGSKPFSVIIPLGSSHRKSNQQPCPTNGVRIGSINCRQSTYLQLHPSVPNNLSDPIVKYIPCFILSIYTGICIIYIYIIYTYVISTYEALFQWPPSTCGWYSACWSLPSGLCVWRPCKTRKRPVIRCEVEAQSIVKPLQHCKSKIFGTIKWWCLTLGGWDYLHWLRVNIWLLDHLMGLYNMPISLSDFQNPEVAIRFV